MVIVADTEKQSRAAWHQPENGGSLKSIMPKRWSKLKSQVEELFVPGLGLAIQCTQIRRTEANDGGLTTELGIFTVRLGKRVIWNFPTQFVDAWTVYPDGGNHDSYRVSELNELLRQYLDTPKAELPEKRFERDFFGLTDLLKAADRRLGRERLERELSGCETPGVNLILAARRSCSPAP